MIISRAILSAAGLSSWPCCLLDGAGQDTSSLSATKGSPALSLYQATVQGLSLGHGHRPPAARGLAVPLGELVAGACGVRPDLDPFGLSLCLLVLVLGLHVRVHSGVHLPHLISDDVPDHGLKDQAVLADLILTKLLGDIHDVRWPLDVCHGDLVRVVGDDLRVRNPDIPKLRL